MKTDSRLKADSNDELACDPAINAPGIGVMVKDGVATLAGHLDTLSGKHAVERAVRRAATGQGALSGGARRRRKRGVLCARRLACRGQTRDRRLTGERPVFFSRILQPKPRDSS
jgi:hypothetical protein